MNYYNEHDKKAAAWLRELIHDGLIPQGDVDERDIQTVQAQDLAGYTQVHLFAGIGGWSYALQLAGWPATRPVWTGSCPCQPYSAAGQHKGDDDARNLWPEMYRLVGECRPECVFGEQVESAIGHGWLDGISGDLERENYSVGAVVLGAHSVGAPHIRQRIFWVAHRCGTERGRWGEQGKRRTGVLLHPADRSCVIGLSDRSRGQREQLARSQGDGLLRPADHNCSVRVVHDLVARSQGHAWNGGDGHEPGRIGAHAAGPTSTAGGNGRLPDAARAQFRRLASAWNEQPDSNNTFILCRDSKIRRVPSEPALFPLADGFSGTRVGLLRGAGNAICPQAAAEFIKAYEDTKNA